MKEEKTMKAFNAPSIEVEKFAIEDVITVSTTNETEEDRG